MSSIGNSSGGASALEDFNKTVQKEDQYFMSKKNTIKTQLKKHKTIMPFLEDPKL
jgi:hypothetical protein